eukprot:GHVU01104237.1.p1 GENE.GHVU01104237.1~~GHVU01104237.1.p1  ORF type:complete len:1407 (-),score=102.41 GHVU01104237.1:31-4251(-)
MSPDVGPVPEPPRKSAHTFTFHYTHAMPPHALCALAIQQPPSSMTPWSPPPTEEIRRAQPHSIIMNSFIVTGNDCCASTNPPTSPRSCVRGCAHLAMFNTCMFSTGEIECTDRIVTITGCMPFGYTAPRVSLSRGGVAIGGAGWTTAAHYVRGCKADAMCIALIDRHPNPIVRDFLESCERNPIPANGADYLDCRCRSWQRCAVHRVCQCQATTLVETWETDSGGGLTDVCRDCVAHLQEGLAMRRKRLREWHSDLQLALGVIGLRVYTKNLTECGDIENNPGPYAFVKRTTQAYGSAYFTVADRQEIAAICRLHGEQGPTRCKWCWLRLCFWCVNLCNCGDVESNPGPPKRWVKAPKSALLQAAEDDSYFLHQCIDFPLLTAYEGVPCARAAFCYVTRQDVLSCKKFPKGASFDAMKRALEKHHAGFGNCCITLIPTSENRAYITWKDRSVAATSRVACLLARTPQKDEAHWVFGSIYSKSGRIEGKTDLNGNYYRAFTKHSSFAPSYLETKTNTHAVDWGSDRESDVTETDSIPPEVTRHVDPWEIPLPPSENGSACPSEAETPVDPSLCENRGRYCRSSGLHQEPPPFVVHPIGAEVALIDEELPPAYDDVWQGNVDPIILFESSIHPCVYVHAGLTRRDARYIWRPVEPVHEFFANLPNTLAPHVVCNCDSLVCDHYYSCNDYITEALDSARVVLGAYGLHASPRYPNVYGYFNFGKMDSHLRFNLEHMLPVTFSSIALCVEIQVVNIVCPIFTIRPQNFGALDVSPVPFRPDGKPSALGTALHFIKRSCVGPNVAVLRRVIGCLPLRMQMLLNAIPRIVFSKRGGGVIPFLIKIALMLIIPVMIKRYLRNVALAILHSAKGLAKNALIYFARTVRRTLPTKYRIHCDMANVTQAVQRPQVGVPLQQLNLEAVVSGQTAAQNFVNTHPVAAVTRKALGLIARAADANTDVLSSSALFVTAAIHALVIKYARIRALYTPVVYEEAQVRENMGVHWSPEFVNRAANFSNLASEVTRQDVAHAIRGNAARNQFKDEITAIASNVLRKMILEHAQRNIVGRSPYALKADVEQPCLFCCMPFTRGAKFKNRVCQRHNRFLYHGGFATLECENNLRISWGIPAYGPIGPVVLRGRTLPVPSSISVEDFSKFVKSKHHHFLHCGEVDGRKLCLLVGYGLSCMPIHVPQSTQSNAVRAIYCRVAVAPKYQAQEEAFSASYLNLFGPLIGNLRNAYKPLSYLEWRETVRRKREMDDALDDYNKHGIQRRRGKLRWKSFTKVEKNPGKKGGKTIIEFKPRLIQAPPDIIHVLLGPYLKPLIHLLSLAWNWQTPLFYAGCATPVEMHAWLGRVKHKCETEDVIMVLIDYSMFDSTQSEVSFSYIEKLYAEVLHLPAELQALLVEMRVPHGQAA